MTTVILALVSVIAVSLVSLVGLATIAMDETRVHRLATLFVSFAVGALLGDAFIHLIPEAFAGPVSKPSSPWPLAIDPWRNDGFLHRREAASASAWRPPRALSRPAGTEAPRAGGDKHSRRRDSQLYRRGCDRRQLSCEPASRPIDNDRGIAPRNTAGVWPTSEFSSIAVSPCEKRCCSTWHPPASPSWAQFFPYWPAPLLRKQLQPRWFRSRRVVSSISPPQI